MSFTDLASLAAQRRQQPQPQPPPQQGQQAQYDPTAPPDPASFTQQPINPTAAADMQAASFGGEGGVPAGLESDQDLGDIEKTKAKTEEPASPDAATPTALALAEESAYPPVVFAPSVYRPPQQARGPDGWGRSWPPLAMAEQYPTVAPSGDLPSPMEGYAEIGRTGLYFQQNGPTSIGQSAGLAGALMTPIAALGNLLSQGKFSRAFTEAQLRQVRIEREKGLEHAETAAREHTRYLMGWGTLFSGINPDHPTMSLDEFRSQADNYLRTWGDEKGRVILHDYGPKALENYLNEQENYRLRLLGSATQIRKAAGPDQDQQDFDALSGKSGAAAAEGTGPLQFKVPGRGPEAPVTPTKDQTDPARAAQAEPLNEYESQLTVNLRDKNNQPLSPTAKANVLRAARDQIEGNPVAIPVDPRGAAGVAIGQVRNGLQANIDDIAKMRPLPGQDPQEFRQKQIEDIRKNVPGEARLIEDLKHLAIDPQTLTIAGGQRRRAVELTAQIYNAPIGQPGHWDQGMFHNYWSVWNNENSKIGQQIQAANRVGTTAISLEAAINNLPIPEDAPLPVTLYNEIISGTLGNNPRYNALNEFLGAFARESMTTQTGRPGGAVSYVNQMMEKLDLRQGKAGLRAAVRASVSATRNLVDGLQTNYAKQTGQPRDTMPGYLPETQEVYDGITMGNPYTGAFPKTAPPGLQEVEPKILDPEGKYRKTRPGWWDKNMEWEPMPREEFNKREQYIRDHPDDPLSNVYKHELGITR